VGLPFGFEEVEGVRLAFLGHDVGGREAGFQGENTQKMAFGGRENHGWTPMDGMLGKER
jgi:hypothetical protein